MDDIDLKALQLLARNGRITWAELAQHLGLSPPSSAERVRRLEESGVVKRYGAVLDPAALGYGFAALIGIDLTHPKYRTKFIELVTARDEILECHHVTGDHDYVLKIVCRDAAHLDHLINDVLKEGSAVARTRTMIVLSTAKDELFAPSGGMEAAKPRAKA
jgi:Lrp/AsnC family transcriptional regulator, leucine-responsive regulatory protein